MASFPALQFVSCKYSELRDLPPLVGTMANVKIMDFTGNHIVLVNDSVGEFQGIESMLLKNNVRVLVACPSASMLGSHQCFAWVGGGGGGVGRGGTHNRVDACCAHDVAPLVLCRVDCTEWVQTGGPHCLFPVMACALPFFTNPL